METALAYSVKVFAGQQSFCMMTWFDANPGWIGMEPALSCSVHVSADDGLVASA